MDRMAYVAMTGASRTMAAQRVVSNNLANVSTAGFRADLVGARSIGVDGPGFPTRINAEEGPLQPDLSTGAVMSTGEPLDVAIQGKGWIAVEAPDGSEAFTRAGAFEISTGGLLMTSSGHRVIGEGGPVAVPPSSQIAIGRDGTVSVVPLGQTADTVVVVDRIKLVNPPAESLVRTADGLFALADGGTALPDAGVSVQSGALESSNVNAASALVEMIELSRLFETQIKLIDTAKRNGDAAGALMRVR